MHKEIDKAEEKFNRLYTSSMVKKFYDEDLMDIQYKFGGTFRLTRLAIRAEEKYKALKEIEDEKTRP